MSRRVFTPEQDKEVAGLYLSGLSSIQIAKRYGVDKSSVLGALERMGTLRRIRKAAQKPPTDKRFAFRPSEEQQIAKIYQVGYTMDRIAKVYKCTTKTISGLLIRQGVSSRQVSQAEESQRKRVEVSNLYQIGIAIDELATRYGVHRQTIGRYLRKTSTKKRPRRLDILNEAAFDCLDSEDALYWLGFSYADGNVNNNIFRWGLGLKDVSHLIKLAAFLDSDNIVKTTDTDCSINFCNPHLAKRLIELGLTPKRGQFFKLAREIPTGMEHHFIRGYIDGDGCISDREKIIILGQIDILTWIKGMFVKYVGASDKVEPRQRRGILEIAWGGRIQFHKLIDYIYKDATIYLERKKVIADKTKKALN